MKVKVKYVGRQGSEKMADTFAKLFSIRKKIREEYGEAYSVNFHPLRDEVHLEPSWESIDYSYYVTRLVIK